MVDREGCSYSATEQSSGDEFAGDTRTSRSISPVPPISAWPPPTLKAWAEVRPDLKYTVNEHARSLWNPLECFFEEQGYRLFVLESAEYEVPANPGEIRAPDPYHVLISDPMPSRFWNKLCGATKLADGTHVVLQLLAIGKDGLDEVEIQKRLHRKPISTAHRNRAVPLLDLIFHEEHELVFGVFPLLCPAFKCPRPGTVVDTLKAFRHIFESVAYLHANLVAHLDIGLGEFLINYGGALDTGFLEGREQWWGECTPGNFFEHFDHQWSITDFGVSVMFDPGSDLPSRKVVGLCAGKFDIPIEQYPKMLGPEVWKPPNIGQPYCPFKHDVYQVGKLLEMAFSGVVTKLPGLASLLASMCQDVPAARPTMSEILHQLDQYITSLTHDDIWHVRYGDFMPSSYTPEHKQQNKRQDKV